MEKDKKSLEELKLYLKIVKIIPSESEWNKYANQQGLLMSQSIEYVYGKRFNQLCRQLIKKR